MAQKKHCPISLRSMVLAVLAREPDGIPFTHLLHEIIFKIDFIHLAETGRTWTRRGPHVFRYERQVFPGGMAIPVCPPLCDTLDMMVADGDIERTVAPVWNLGIRRPHHVADPDNPGRRIHVGDDTWRGEDHFLRETRHRLTRPLAAPRRIDASHHHLIVSVLDAVLRRPVPDTAANRERIRRMAVVNMLPWARVIGEHIHARQIQTGAAVYLRPPIPIRPFEKRLGRILARPC